MSKFVDFLDKTKRYAWFGPKESKAFLITAVVLSFMLSFRDWGTTQVNIGLGIYHWFLAFLVVVGSLLIAIMAKRLAALNIGLQTEYKMWITGLLGGLLFCVLSNGYVWFLLVPGSTAFHHLTRHRIGHMRYGINMWSKAMLIIVGLVSTMILAFFAKVLLSMFPNSYVLQKMLLFNIALAVITVLPFPPLDGTFLFFATRELYLFVLGIIAGYGLLLYLSNITVAIIGSIIIGVLLTTLFYLFSESGFVK